MDSIQSGGPESGTCRDRTSRQTNRRGMLRAVLGVAAAGAGMGTLLDTSAGTAQADGALGATTFTGPVVFGAGVVGTTVFNGNTIFIPNITIQGGAGSAISVNGGDTGLNIQGSGTGISVQSAGTGISIQSGVGIHAQGLTSYGVYGSSTFGDGVYGTSGAGGSGAGGSGAGVHGVVSGYGQSAVLAEGNAGTGVTATSTGGTAVSATSGSTGAYATAIHGVVSSPTPGSFSAALRGENMGTGGLGIGVWGSQNGNGWGVFGTSANGDAMYGSSGGGTGVHGASSSGFGVDAYSGSGTALRACAGTPNQVALLAQGLLQVQASPGGGASPVGQFQMDKGTSAVTVATAAATAASTILLTPLGDPGARLWISARAAGKFMVSASAPLPAASTIQYLIIN